ncbi:hypothetical protein LCGC14_0632340 [marine sediment metagenome]|uniref:Uncharacterized protein n=1 Tax=marine sediment metagenome TaxID=412755 RepID=A0A0F9TN04_9ZZZZ
MFHKIFHFYQIYHKEGKCLLQDHLDTNLEFHKIGFPELVGCLYDDIFDQPLYFDQFS